MTVLASLFMTGMRFERCSRRESFRQALMEAAIARSCEQKGVAGPDFAQTLDRVMAGIGFNHDAEPDEDTYRYTTQTQAADKVTMTLPNDWGGSEWTGRSAAKLMRYFLRLGHYNGSTATVSAAAVQEATRALGYPGVPTNAISLYELTDPEFGHDKPPARSGPNARVAWGAGQNVAMSTPNGTSSSSASAAPASTTLSARSGRSTPRSTTRRRSARARRPVIRSRSAPSPWTGRPSAVPRRSGERSPTPRDRPRCVAHLRRRACPIGGATGISYTARVSSPVSTTRNTRWTARAVPCRPTRCL